MRGLIPNTETAHPLGPALPAIYQEDGFIQRMTAAFDDSLAPIFLVLDNLSAYLDPLLAPADFVEWLATWVGQTLNEGWSPRQKREVVARATKMYRSRGTARGLEEEIALIVGSRPEIVESGGVAWSTEAGSEFPGNNEPELVIRIPVKDAGGVDLGRVDAAVRAIKPAHMPHRVELVGT